MPPQIVVEDLVKSYRIAERAPGLWGGVRGLVHRRYRELRALDGVSFSIDAGELVGYIGPNGAGKSTTVKTLSGILVPDSGRCEVRGRVPWRQRVEHVAEIGVVFGQRTQLWWDLPVIESFELLRFAVCQDRIGQGLELDPGTLHIVRQLYPRPNIRLTLLVEIDRIALAANFLSLEPPIDPVPDPPHSTTGNLLPNAGCFCLHLLPGITWNQISPYVSPASSRTAPHPLTASKMLFAIR